MTGIVWWDGQRMSTLSAPEAAASLLVLYDDPDLMAVFKPPGLLSQGPGGGHLTVVEVVRAWLGRGHAVRGEPFVGLVHRLDRPVGGVLVLAKTPKAASGLSEQFRDGVVRKVYLAVVEGRVPPSGTFADCMARGPDGVSRVVTSPRGRLARLDYRRIDAASGASLVEIRPHTGRTHQIRLQLSHAGHPIVGDVKYGSGLRIPGRIALLAKEIEFIHPCKDVPMDLHAPTPPDWPWPLPPVLERRRG